MDEPERFIDVDDRSFGQLVDRYKERIYLVVLRIVKNKDEAMDLAQEAFVKAYYNRKSFRAESGFYTWIYRIAVNLALNYISRNHDRRAESIDRIAERATMSRCSAQVKASLTASEAGSLEKRELAQVIAAAIDKLPPRQKTVFILRHYEEKSHAVIASILSVTEGAIKANYHQAVRKLRQSLSAYLKEGRLIS